MAADNETGKFLIIAKIVQVSFIVTIAAYADIIYVSLPSIDFAILPPGDPLLTIITGVLGFIAVAFIVFGYFWPRWVVSKLSQPETQMFFVAYIGRAAIFESVAIDGLILGILGSGWQITLPFLVVSAVALILTFPTGGRWKSFRG